MEVFVLLYKEEHGRMFVMSDKIPFNVVNAIKCRRWAITGEYLQLITSIAQREFSDKNAVLASKSKRVSEDGVNYKIVDNVAIIDINGVIIPYADMFAQISGAVSIETLAKSYKECLNNNSIKGIVLNVNSPGGDVNGVNEFSKLIRENRGVKPTVAYVGGMCCSAALWISSAANMIISDETAVLGSIGVVAQFEIEETPEGVKRFEVISDQTPLKRQDLSSEAGMEALKKELRELATIFINSVATSRNKSAEYVEKNFGRGGTMLASESIDVGMSDNIGTLEGVITKLKQGDVMSMLIETTSSSVDGNTIVSAELNEEVSVDYQAADDNKEENDDMEQEDINVPEDDEENKDNKDEASEDDDELEAMLKSFGAEKDALKKTNFALYNAIKAEGVNEERNRISEIHMLSKKTRGNQTMIEQAMFKTSMGAKDVAYEIMMAEEDKKTNSLRALNEDKANMIFDQKSGATQSSIKKSDGSAFAEANNKQAIESIKKGYENGGKYGSSTIRS